MSGAGKRYHLDQGALLFGRHVSVFINCPFDIEFRPVFNGIIFAAVCCGFLPRCAVETGNGAEARMDRVVKTMEKCKYSIHDLSRCTGEGESNLARFNMPLELGIAMSQRFGSSNTGGHDWLLLVPPGHVYKRFLSDLSGYDPTEYDGSVASVVPAVMSWLATRPDAVQVPAPREVLTVLPDFTKEREALCEKWCGHETWPDLVMSAIHTAARSALIPEPGLRA